MKSKTFYVAAFHIVCWILVALPAVVFVPQHVRWDTGLPSALMPARIVVPCVLLELLVACAALLH